MKNFLCACWVLFSAVMGPASLSALPEPVEVERYLTHSWGDEDGCLYLYLELDDRLELDISYATFSIANGLGCEFTCRPIREGTVFSAKGDELQEIKVAVLVRNRKVEGELQFTIMEERDFIGTKQTTKYTGTLLNPALDLSERPVLYPFDDSETKLLVLFKMQEPSS